MFPIVVNPFDCVLRLKLISSTSPFLRQAGPVIASKHRAGPVVGWPAALVGHLQEQQIGELLDVVAIAHAVVAQDVAVVPEFLNDLGAHLRGLFEQDFKDCPI
jgi:hypothetical protein